MNVRMDRDLISDSLKKASREEDINLEIPENEEFGDYSTNLAMILAKRGRRNSQKVAQEIVRKLRKDMNLTDIVSRVEIAGPGFINFYLSNTALLVELGNIIRRGAQYGSSNLGQKKTIIIDYSSPNIAKRFGIGHLRSTIIGQSLYNLYKFLGYKVIGDNHLGDWGTQFGSLLYQITSKKLDPSKLTIDNLEKLYVDFHREEQTNPSLHEEAKKWFKKLEEGDILARKIWKAVVRISLAEFERIYNLLGVKIDFTYGESFYENKMPAVIEEIRKRGLLRESEGAQVVQLEGMPPAIIIKSDGTTTYLTRDLATIKFRLKKWNPDFIVYEVGSEQTLHFKQLFEIARLLGWAENRQFVHIGHGLIRFRHGKMSTRKGDTIRLEEVLNQAREKAKKIIAESKTGRGLKENQKEEVARAVGIGAVKYFDLMHHPTTDIVFDWGKIFILEGNSAPYLQYTAARAKSVLSRAKLADVDFPFNIEPNTEEILLLRWLVKFPEVIKQAAYNFSPNLLCNYLFNLAQKFNNFYNQHRIIGGEKEEFRISLTKATSQVLTNGLTILGLESPERM